MSSRIRFSMVRFAGPLFWLLLHGQGFALGHSEPYQAIDTSSAHLQKVDSLVAQSSYQAAMQELEKVLRGANGERKVTLLRTYAAKFPTSGALVQKCRCLYLLAQETPRADEKRRCLQRAYALLDSTGEFLYFRDLAKIAGEIANLEQSNDSWKQAADANAKAGIALLSGFNLPTGVTESLEGAGWALLFQGILGGKYQSAIQCLDKAAKYYSRAGLHSQAAQMRFYTASLQYDLREYDQSVERYKELLTPPALPDSWQQLARRGLLRSLVFSAVSYPKNSRTKYLQLVDQYFPQISASVQRLVETGQLDQKLRRRLRLPESRQIELTLLSRLKLIRR